MKTLREIIIQCNDNLRDWVVSRPLRKEKDPKKRFEIKLWLEITGHLTGAGDGAWESYKKNYYDNLPDEEKKLIQSCLLTMLQSSRYNIKDKSFIAQVCADFYLKDDALPIVQNLLRQAKDPIDIREFESAKEALSRGISMYDLVSERFKSGKRQPL